MKKTANLFLIILKNNIVREMEFRSNFIINFFVSIMWISLSFVTIEIYFQYTNQILGWTKYEMYALIGIARIVKGIFDTVFRPNILSFPDAVNRGELDYVLTRPVDSQFMVSARRQALFEIIGLIMGAMMIAYYFIGGKVSFNFYSLVFVLNGIFFGTLAYYSFYFLLSNLSLYMTRMTAIKELQDVFSQTMRYPTDMYSRGNVWIEIILLPILVFATLPARALLKNSFNLALLHILLSLSFFIIGRLFWNYSIKRYSSASS